MYTGWLNHEVRYGNIKCVSSACNVGTDVVTTRVLESIVKLPSPVNVTDKIRSDPLKGLDRPAVKTYAPADWTEFSGRTTW